MIFESEAVEAAFHALPTDTQLKYTRLEYLLADIGSVMSVCAVILNPHNDMLEVMVRITHQLDLNPGSTDG